MVTLHLSSRQAISEFWWRYLLYNFPYSFKYFSVILMSSSRQYSGRGTMSRNRGIEECWVQLNFISPSRDSQWQFASMRDGFYIFRLGRLPLSSNGGIWKWNLVKTPPFKFISSLHNLVSYENNMYSPRSQLSAHSYFDVLFYVNIMV